MSNFQTETLAVVKVQFVDTYFRQFKASLFDIGLKLARFLLSKFALNFTGENYAVSKDF